MSGSHDLFGAKEAQAMTREEYYATLGGRGSLTWPTTHKRGNSGGGGTNADGSGRFSLTNVERIA